MANILLIADQARLEQIVTSAAKACNAHVRHISSLHIPEEAKTEQPAVIFIQNRLSGLSGQILARHLRSVFSSGSAAIILLGEEPDDAQSSFQPADKCINLSESDSEILRKATDAINDAEKPGTMDGGETPLAAVEIDDRVSISGGPVPVQEHSPVDSPFLHKLEGALSDLEPVPLRPADEGSNVASSPLQADEVAEPCFSDGRQGLRHRTWFVLALAVALAASLAFFLGGKGTKGKNSAPAALTGNQLPQGMNELPPFVPRQGFDAGYGKGHPGWERYTDSGTEFKIFRQNGTIKAMQIIDRSGKGVPAPLIDTVLRQGAGTGRYNIEATGTKSSYIIEKGSAGKTGVIVYRRQSDRQMKAFVLYFR